MKTNLVGKRFGNLVVVSKNTEIHDWRARWNCVCDCGNEIVARADSLTSGQKTSCGCQAHKKWSKSAREKHGMAKTELYRKWASIKQRCLDESRADYERYGGAGIAVCDEWKNSFVSFMNWSLNNGYKEGLSIDRIDNNKEYCPENCRWIKLEEQSANRRSNIYITYNGETKTLTDWCKYFNVDYSRTKAKIKKYGFSFEEAIFSQNYVLRDERKKLANK